MGFTHVAKIHVFSVFRRCVYFPQKTKDGVYICTHNKYCQIFLPSLLGWTKIYILNLIEKKKKRAYPTRIKVSAV